MPLCAMGSSHPAVIDPDLAVVMSDLHVGKAWNEQKFWDALVKERHGRRVAFPFAKLA